MLPAVIWSKCFLTVASFAAIDKKLRLSLPAVTATPMGKSAKVYKFAAEPLELELLEEVELVLDELELVDELELLDELELEELEELLELDGQLFTTPPALDGCDSHVAPTDTTWLFSQPQPLFWLLHNGRGAS